MSSAPPKLLDLHQIYTWLVTDRIVAQADARAAYSQAQALQKASAMAMHPLVAVAMVLRARSEEARTRATEKLRELATLSAQLHTALLEARLQERLRP